MSAPGILFLTWQPTYAEYTTVCRYLRLTPQPQLYARLLSHLAEAALTQPPLSAWARHLSRGRRGRFWLACMDLVSRLFMPTHPVRFWLNTTLALHECTAQGHAELSRVPRGWWLWLTLPWWCGVLAATALLAGGWLMYRGLGFGLRLGWSHRADTLAGRGVLVTGASRGLGWDLAMLALERGARVYAVIRDHRHLPEAAKHLPAKAPIQWIEADLAVPGALTQALQSANIQAATIDYALLAAGVKHDATSVLDEAALRQTIQVNLYANVEFAAWYHAHARRGRIVLVSSMGRWHGMPATGGYNASKAALSIWGESLDMELTARAMPAVLIVEPGLFASGMVHARGLQGLLSLPRQEVAQRIIEAALQGRRSLRPPLWFAWLTWGLCLTGRRLRAHVLRQARGG